MKAIWTTLAVLFTTASLSALPLGNPWEASLLCTGVVCKGKGADFCDPCACWRDAWSLRVGFYGDFVFNRRMEIDTKESSASIRRTEIFTQAGYLVLNFWDRLDFFTTLGASHISLFAPRKNFGNPLPDNYIIHLESVTAFSWSVGARATLYTWRCFAIGAEGQYFRTRPHINYEQSDFRPVFYPSGERLKYHEWQVGLGASYRIPILCDATAFVPYVGLRWGKGLLNTDNFSLPAPDSLTFFNMEPQREWGYAVGATLVGCNKISVTAEARFRNESAFYVNSQLRF